MQCWVINGDAAGLRLGAVNKARKGKKKQKNDQAYTRTGLRTENLLTIELSIAGRLSTTPRNLSIDAGISAPYQST